MKQILITVPDSMEEEIEKLFNVWFGGKIEPKNYEDVKSISIEKLNPKDISLRNAAPELLEACNMARIEIENGRADTLTVDVLLKAIEKATK